LLAFGAMSAERRVTYIDSSAIVKLVVAEPESKALRSYLARRRSLVTSALARTEVARALLPSGREAVARGEDALRRIQLLRVNDRVLSEAGRMEPAELRSLDAIHLASATQLGPSVKQIVTYDERMAEAAQALGWSVASPS
jgi:predicted nucleic acid-binding protein